MAEEGLVQLNKEQLLQLSKIIYEEEYEQIRQIPFDCEEKRVRHFDACKSNHKTVKRLLNSSPDENMDARLYEVWHLTWEVLKGAINFGLQAIRCYSVRVEFLEKVMAQSDESYGVLRRIDPNNQAAVRRVTRDAQKFKKGIDHFNKNHGSLVSKAFSQELQEEGIGYRQLIERYMEKLEFPGTFEELTAAEKYLLSQEIIIDSGRGTKIIDEAFASARKELVAGFALLAFVAAITVCDILVDPNTPVMIRVMKTVRQRLRR